MTSTQFTASVLANILYWQAHPALSDAHRWPVLDRERENLFRAVVFGLRLQETYWQATELAQYCYNYVYERGYWNDWIPVLELALGDCPADGLELKGQLLHHLGCLLRKVRRLDEALATHQQELEIGRRLGDRTRIALAQYQLGQVCFRLRDYVRAEEYAQLARAYFETETDYAERTAHTLNLLGIIATGRADFSASLDYLSRARGLFREVGNDIELGRTLVNMCVCLEAIGRAEEVLALQAEAAAIFDAYDLQIERTNLYHIVGTMYFKLGDLSQAEAVFRQADSLSMRRSGPIYLQSLTEMNLGNVLLYQGHFMQSRTYFLSSIAGFRQVNSRTLLANSLDGLAETLIELGDPGEAIKLYEEALAIVQAIPEDAFAKRMEKRFQQILGDLSMSGEEE